MLANIIRNTKKTGIGGGGGGIVTGGDPYYSAVSLLLSMDGTNGSTTFTDSGPNALAVTAVGNTQISTTQSKYGGASGYFDGTGDYLSISPNTAIDLSSGDFTIEFWIRPAPKTNAVDAAFGYSNYACMFYHNGTNWTLEMSSTGFSNQLVISFAVTLNTWQHIAIVRSGTSVVVYKNGVSSASGTFTGTVATNGRTLRIGDNGNSQNINGYMDDFRISKFARYVSTFTPPTAALPTTASSTPADPYYGYTSLLLHMDGSNASTNFVDSGPNALTVTAVGNAQISTSQSKYGGASAYFDGSGDYLSLPALMPAIGSGDFTIEFWIYPSLTYSGTYAAILDSRTSGNGAGLIYFGYTSVANEIGWYENTGYLVKGTLTQSSWNHVAVIRNGSTIRMFVNGVLSQSATNSTNLSVPFNRIASSWDSFAFQGYIDDLRITKGYARYQSSFTPPTQALPEYANGNDRYFSNVSLLLHMDGANGSTTFTDNSANARTITAVGNAQISTTQSQFGGASAYFDGTGDYLSLSGGMPSGTGTAFTIECWIRLDDLSAYRAITRTAGGLDIGIQPNGLINCDQTSVGIIANSATGVITAGTWYHVAVTRDTSNNYKIYVNGTQVASATNSFSVTAATTIGYSAYSGSHYFKGYIDDFRVTNALRYTANFTPPTSAFPNA